MPLRVAAPIARCCAACFLWAAAGVAAAAVPHLNDAGEAEYRSYVGAAGHRAFAIAPGGAWGWKAEAGDTAEAEDGALAACRVNTQQKCVLYSVDGASVFDAVRWKRLWGPYAGLSEARRAPRGYHVGERFPDVAFSDGNGRKMKLSDLRGKVAVLHFWGSWCGPCRREMPELQTLYESLKGRKDVAFALMQVRETYAVSRRWTGLRSLRLPLYDSGSTGEGDDVLRLADGEEIRDRDVAMSFPTTYVVDKHGIVLFSHVGPVSDWSQYRVFLIDAATRSGH